MKLTPVYDGVTYDAFQISCQFIVVLLAKAGNFCINKTGQPPESPFPQPKIPHYCSPILDFSANFLVFPVNFPVFQPFFRFFSSFFQPFSPFFLRFLSFIPFLLARLINQCPKTSNISFTSMLFDILGILWMTPGDFMMDLSFGIPWKSSNAPEDPDPFIPMYDYWAKSLIYRGMEMGNGERAYGNRIMRISRGLWRLGPGILRHVRKFGHEAAFGADESARDKICSWIKFDAVTLMEG